MAHKKNGFLNFCFSLLPGAGQMYQGFIKRGVSIMTLFFGWLCICTFLGVDELLFFLPVIWFFGFFDAIHRNSLSDAERSVLKDEYVLVHENEFDGLTLRKFRIPAAALLIFIGCYEILKLFIHTLIEHGFLFWDSVIVDMVYDTLPKMIFSIVIILVGVYLISGKRQEISGREQETESLKSEKSREEQSAGFQNLGREEQDIVSQSENLERQEMPVFTGGEKKEDSKEEEDGGEEV